MHNEKRKLRNKSSQAYRFHEMAWGFLSGIGFELDNDPTIALSPYQLTVARYKSNEGFYISIGFDPADSNSVGVNCGRRWRYLKADHLKSPYFLSGEYSALAKKLDIDIQSTFRLGYGEEIPQTMKKIIQLLKDTLPAIMEKITLQDLIDVEKEKFGAEQRAISIFGEYYEDYVEISLYEGK